MPAQRVIQRAERARRQGASPSSQAGEFVRDEIHKIRRREHGARSARQAIAIGLSKARRAGVDLPPSPRGRVSERSLRNARYAYEAGQGMRRVRRRPRAARAAQRALRRESTRAASHEALSRHAREAARQRTAAERSESARQAARTKGAAGRSAASRKAARTRDRRSSHGR